MRVRGGGVTHHHWWCLETFPYKSMAWPQPIQSAPLAEKPLDWKQAEVDAAALCCKISNWVHSCTCKHRSLTWAEFWMGYDLFMRVSLVAVHWSKDCSKGNSWTFDHDHKPQASGDSIGSHITTYVVCSATRSICAPVFLAFLYSLCQQQKHSRMPRPVWVKWERQEDNAQSCFGHLLSYAHVLWLWRMCFGPHCSD